MRRLTEITPALDRGVDVLVRVEEIQVARVDLAPDPPEATLDRGQLRCGQDAGCGQAARVGEAARDVKRVELEIGLER